MAEKDLEIQEEEIIASIQEHMRACGYVTSVDVCYNCKYHQIWAEMCCSESTRCAHPDYMDDSEQTLKKFGYRIAPYTTDTGWCEKYERDD